MTTHQYRRDQLVRIATKGICNNEDEVKYLTDKKQLLIYRFLASWTDDIEVTKTIELIKPTFLDYEK